MAKYYRLRNGSTIVGYTKESVTGEMVYSKDNIWWSGFKINATDMDRAIGLQDRNRREIFEHDIVEWKSDPRLEFYNQGAILFSFKEENFVLKDFESGAVEPLFVGGESLFTMDDFRVISYTFINPQVEEFLKEEGDYFF